MAKRKMKLGLPEVAAVIDERHAKERDGCRKNRWLAVKLVARGAHTSAEIADLCGIARGHLFAWMKTLREGGLEALLQREKPGPKEGTRRDLSATAGAELEARLAAGEFVSAVAAQRWLRQAHGVERPYQTVWRWLKKAGGVLWVPLPESLQERPRGGWAVSGRAGGKA